MQMEAVIVENQFLGDLQWCFPNFQMGWRTEKPNRGFESTQKLEEFIEWCTVNCDL